VRSIVKDGATPDLPAHEVHWSAFRNWKEILMGLVALFGFLVCTSVVFSMSAGVAFLTTKLFKFENVTARRICFASIALGVPAAIWTVFNFQNLYRQHELNAVMTGCGWNAYKTISDVEGVFLDSETEKLDALKSGYFLELYPAVEYRHGKEVIRRKHNAFGKVESETLSQRTFRFGVRTTSEVLQNNIQRQKIEIVDFDSQDTLAENVSYSLNDRKQTQLKDLLLAFVTYHPKGCGWMSGQPDDRYMSVLQPRGVIPKEQYESISGVIPSDAALEVIEVEVFTPERVLSGESWGSVVFDASRHAACQQMTQPEGGHSPLLTFTGDTTGMKRVSSGAGFQICEPDSIWMGRYVDGSDRKYMTIEKYTANGTLMYKIRFAKPDEPGGFLGGIAGPTFRAENHYLYFDWWNSNQSGSDRLVVRRMKVRVKEPS